jgi:hypothetical protein
MKNLASQVVLAQQDFAAAVSGSAFDARFLRGAGLVAVCAVANSTAITFVDGDVGVVANTIAAPAHGWATGRKVAATTGGTLPGGLSATTYYVIVVDSDTIKLASSLVNAQAGTAVDITSAAGGGTHTLTPAALSGASVKFQWSPDDSNWYDLAGQSQNITVTGNLGFLVTDTGYKSIRAVTAISAGQVNIQVIGNILKYNGQY